MSDGQPTRTNIIETEAALLRALRDERKQERQTRQDTGGIPLTVGQKVADAVAAGMGSWRFIIIQSTILLIWILLTSRRGLSIGIPIPFILLNLALSFRAAYPAPFIMMSQNRQGDIDRRKAQEDYRINIKAELEIELLHQKLDELREREVMSLVESVKTLSKLLEARTNPPEGN